MDFSIIDIEIKKAFAFNYIKTYVKFRSKHKTIINNLDHTGSIMLFIKEAEQLYMTNIKEFRQLLQSYTQPSNRTLIGDMLQLLKNNIQHRNITSYLNNSQKTVNKNDYIGGCESNLSIPGKSDTMSQPTQDSLYVCKLCGMKIRCLYLSTHLRGYHAIATTNPEHYFGRMSQYDPIIEKVRKNNKLIKKRAKAQREQERWDWIYTNRSKRNDFIRFISTPMKS